MILNKFRDAYNILISILFLSIFCLNAILIQAAETFIITEKYQDTKGTTVKNDTSTSVASKGKYEKEAPDIKDYVYLYFKVGDKKYENTVVNVDDVGKDLVVIFVYADDKNNNGIPDDDEDYKVTEKFQKEDGTPIAEDKVTDVEWNSNFEATAPEIKGYVAVNSKFNGKLMGDPDIGITSITQSVEVIYIYKVDSDNDGVPDDDPGFTITEKYQDEKGNEISPDTSTHVIRNRSYSRKAPEIKKYIVIAIKIDGEIMEGDTVTNDSINSNHEIVFIYTADSNEDGIPDSDPGCFITEKYETKDGTVLRPSTTTHVDKNGKYSKDAPDIDGYVAVAIKIDGTLSKGNSIKDATITEDHEFIFIYEEDEENENDSSNTSGSNTSNLNTSSSNTSSSNTSSSNTSSSNTSSSNTSGLNTSSSNTSSSNTSSLNTSSLNTSSSITSSPNTSSLNTSGSNTSGSNTSSLNTSSLNTSSLNTSGSNTSSLNTSGSNTSSLNTSSPNTSSPNTSSLNTSSSNTSSPNTSSLNTSGSNTSSSSHGINTTNVTGGQSIGEAPTLEVPDYEIFDLGTQVDTKSLISEASDPEDGDDLKDKVVITGNLNVLKVGVYTINYGLTDNDGNTTTAKCVITIKGKDTVLIGDNAIDAHDFSINVSEVDTLTDADIINKAEIKAWNIKLGIDLTDKLKIDATNIKNSAGQYKVAIRINILPAISGKDSSGNDIAIVNATVYGNNATNNNSTNSNTTNNNSTGSLPTTGEKYTYFNINIK